MTPIMVRYHTAWQIRYDLTFAIGDSDSVLPRNTGTYSQDCKTKPKQIHVASIQPQRVSV